MHLILAQVERSIYFPSLQFARLKYANIRVKMGPAK
jgi:hypothetical protein